MKIKTIQLNLLEDQTDIILKSLSIYTLIANYLLERNGKYTSKENEMQISLITDTYEQISSQIYKNEKTEGVKQNFKKIS